jgi:hypothetical protein
MLQVEGIYLKRVMEYIIWPIFSRTRFYNLLKCVFVSEVATKTDSMPDNFSCQWYGEPIKHPAW